nr:hypothetical protein [Lachnospiraceae bacterium]
MILDALFGQSIISEYLIPYSEGSLLSQLLDLGNALEQEYRADGTYIKLEYMSADSDMRLLNQAQAYLLN